MRKHNEGYALPFVLVVMTVLFLIVTALLSFSLRNLQSQKNSIERMRYKYAAEGAIEMVVAQLNEPLIVTGPTPEAIKAGIDAICPSECTADSCHFEITGIAASTYEVEGSFTLTSTCGSVQIVCELVFSGTIANDQENGTYIITASKIAYTSYEIGGVEE